MTTLLKTRELHSSAWPESPSVPVDLKGVGLEAWRCAVAYRSTMAALEHGPPKYFWEQKKLLSSCKVKETPYLSDPRSDFYRLLTRFDAPCSVHALERLSVPTHVFNNESEQDQAHIKCHR